MRTVICHFYNEEYLLPWWLRHHTALFDHGVMIDHGCTDGSLDIIRTLAPHWKIVRSRFTEFDSFLTDFEVMGYEENIPGWKIALNVTEFLAPAVPLDAIEQQLTDNGQVACCCSGYIMVDAHPDQVPDHARPLPLQKPWGIDDNAFTDPVERVRLGLPESLNRNRVYHRAPVGMYTIGRHGSYLPDSHVRFVDLPLLHFGYSPWNDQYHRRARQIGARVSATDIRRGWVNGHLRPPEMVQATYELLKATAANLQDHPFAGQSLQRLDAGPSAGPGQMA